MERILNLPLLNILFKRISPIYPVTMAKTIASIYQPVFSASDAPNLTRSTISSTTEPISAGTAERNANLHRSVLEVSESTLYPVLRRLQKDECLEAYNMEYAGRNRKYYKLTDKGAAQLNLYRSEWEIYSSKITRMFEEGV